MFFRYNDAKTMAEGCRLADGGVVMNKILIVEDDEAIRTELQTLLDSCVAGITAPADQ